MGAAGEARRCPDSRDRYCGCHSNICTWRKEAKRGHDEESSFAVYQCLVEIAGGEGRFDAGGRGGIAVSPSYFPAHCFEACMRALERDAVHVDNEAGWAGVGIRGAPQLRPDRASRENLTNYELLLDDCTGDTHSHNADDEAFDMGEWKRVWSMMPDGQLAMHAGHFSWCLQPLVTDVEVLRSSTELVEVVLRSCLPHRHPERDSQQWTVTTDGYIMLDAAKRCLAVGAAPRKASNTARNWDESGEQRMVALASCTGDAVRWRMLRLDEPQPPLECPEFGWEPQHLEMPVGYIPYTSMAPPAISPATPRKRSNLVKSFPGLIAGQQGF
ncbi:hypothetical protein CYMTET_49189 [Cymbomonas tetramitiformis]|uniref:Ricin B lectin domain-containing protein n=1 Tax=Cymbomonas tetramitiformis TaxID=36881 RepID=A0AAE0EW14_9CHLO|nr:hypothetical protein CYMTET_49189 [Cymbomonas tetramitiformis]